MQVFHTNQIGKQIISIRWINMGSASGRSARDAGLKEGDIVTGLAGAPIPTTMTVKGFHIHVQRNYKVGDELPLTVLRDGKKREIRVKLVE